MDDFEQLEAQGQTNIFDFLDEKQRKQEMEIGSKVMIRFYVDELDHVRTKASWMLGIGTIVDAKLDFWIVEFDGKEIAVEPSKLLLANHS